MTSDAKVSTVSTLLFTTPLFTFFVQNSSPQYIPAHHEESRLGLAIPSILAPFLGMGKEGGPQNQQNIRCPAAPSRGRGLLNIPANPEAVFASIKIAVLQRYNCENGVMAADYPTTSLPNAAVCLSRMLVLNKNTPATAQSRVHRRREGKGPISSSGSLPCIYNPTNRERRWRPPRLTPPRIV